MSIASSSTAAEHPPADTVRSPYADAGTNADADITAGPGTDRRARGLRTLDAVTANAGTTVVAGLRDLAPDLADFIVDFAYGDVIARPGLDLRTRQLATVATLAALGHAQPQLAVHIQGALNVGATRAEIIEVLLQTAVYAGFPAAINAINTARRAFAEADGAG
ncbi:carboxymuconolactone decarboxylase family protein [Derxia gummosa]|uniref:Carboxymuconolactone decarboxylase family protein n=1 Tax=Derxia gummosa DSM 723 TaxID=1121388 RepID=A0A8B6XAK5_9BURK|nr:carboxymuconolactone decarboxylase family protein [Derxia gummosa]